MMITQQQATEQEKGLKNQNATRKLAKSPTLPDAPTEVRPVRLGEVSKKRSEQPDRPSPKEKKLSGGEYKHLTMSQCSLSNPMAARYLEFARQVLSVLDNPNLSNQEEALVTLCRGFHLTEFLKKKKEVTKPKKKKEEVLKSVENKEKEGVPPSLIHKARLVLPTFSVPVSIGTGNDRVKLVYPSQSDKDKAVFRDHSYALTALSYKDRKVLTKMLEDVEEDRKYLNSDDYRTAIRELCILRQITDPKLAHDKCAAMFEKTPLKGRGSIVAMKQYIVLNDKKKLLSKTHLMATLRTLESLSELDPPRGVDSWDSNSLTAIATKNKVTEEQLTAEFGRPTWKGAQNLGRCHPRILALQVNEMNDEKVSDQFEAAFFDKEGGIKRYWLPILEIQKAFVPEGNDSESKQDKGPPVAKAILKRKSQSSQSKGT